MCTSMLIAGSSIEGGTQPTSRALQYFSILMFGVPGAVLNPGKKQFVHVSYVCGHMEVEY